MSAGEKPAGSDGVPGPAKGSKTFSLSLGNSSSKGIDYTTRVRTVLQMNHFKNCQTVVRLFALAVGTILVFVTGCSTLQPPDANGPGINVPAYPIVVLEDAANAEQAVVAWRQLAQRDSIAATSEITLNPLTATVSALPTNLGGPILLPRVGAGSTSTEEEIRESLRRFLSDWRSLIGADPNELSLVERVDESVSVKRARYEQRPFRYPLRGGYGNLVIRFNTNRELIELSSNCLRNTDRLQNAISELNPEVSAEDAVNSIRGKPFSVASSSGELQTFTLAGNEPAEAKQLVVYAMPSPSQPNVLQLRLAWEIETPNAAVHWVYLDAISSEVIAAN